MASYKDILFAVVPLIVLVLAAREFMQDECMRAFYRIGRLHPARGERPATKMFRFNAKMARGDKTIYSGGVLSITDVGLYIQHELVFRPFLRTSLIPRASIAVDSSNASLLSVVLTLDGQYDIKLFCRHRAIVEMCSSFRRVTVTGTHTPGRNN